MVQEKRTVTREIGNQTIVITNVPVFCCTHCQEILYSAQTVKKMDELIRRFPNKTLLVYPNLLDFNSELRSYLSKLDPHNILATASEEPVKRYEIVVLANSLRSQLRSA
ncbi:type II toxin-antitoxin system MqsA family antitoxin [Syntrophothermus sp.]|uniref:type II toxin-antitoxin system MqsA family antitoxin n=1 Tax=Syntrophothermus sp. TaxID=2736299 RepID=UPI00338E9397